MSTFINSFRFYGGAANTFIGGVSSNINTPALLAAKLQNYPSGTAFDVSKIFGFTIVGSDIECYIAVDHSINSNFNTQTVSYYYGLNNNCKRINALQHSLLPNAIVEITDVIIIGSRSFSYGYATKFIFKNCTQIINEGFWDMYGGSGGTKNPEVIYIPNVISLGSNATQESVFTLSRVNSSTKIYCNPFLQTSNSGAEEGDIAYSRSLGATIRYVTNFTVPNVITDLAVATVYATSIDLVWTLPSSTNTIDYYEIYVDGIFNKKVTTLSATITGLTYLQTYNFTVIAVDIFYNKSEVSNILTQEING